MFDVCVYAFKHFDSTEKELILTAYGVPVEILRKIFDNYKGPQFIISIIRTKEDIKHE